MSKGKGVKLDWNLLARDSNQDTQLPSAPGQGAASGYGYNDSRGGRGGGRDRGGGWDRNPGGDGGDRWGNRMPGGSGDARGGTSRFGERPKLNLSARTLPTDPLPGQPAATNESTGNTTGDGGGKDDKWDNVFSKGTAKAGGGDARNLPRGDARAAPDDGGFQEAPKFNRSSARTAPDAELAASMQNAVISTDKVKKIDPKKAAKAAARAEEEKKKQQEKEAAQAAKDAKMQAEKEALNTAKKLAEDIVAKGIKGSALVKHIEGMETKPQPASLVSVLLSKITDPTASPAAACKWCEKAEYGEALATLNEGSTLKQLFCLYEVQKYFDSIKFPKIEIKGEKKNLIEVVFQVMYTNEIIDNDGFGAWSEDDNEEIPGKLNAVVQTTNFISMLDAVDEEEDEEEYEDDEVDAVRETL